MKTPWTSRQKLRRLTTAGLLTAAALILSWIEAILPFSIGIPGIKLGLCHIITLLALYRLSPWETAAITVLRVSLVALLFGSVASLAYSAAGGLISLGVMMLLKRLKYGEKPVFSLLGVSIAGAVTHNLAQFATAACLMQTAALLSYLPILLATGVLTGALIGMVAAGVADRLRP